MTEDTQLFSKPYLGNSRLDRMMGVIFALSGEVAVLGRHGGAIYNQLP